MNLKRSSSNPALHIGKKPWTNPGRHQCNALVMTPMKELQWYSYIGYFNVWVPDTLPVIKFLLLFFVWLVFVFFHIFHIFNKYFVGFFSVFSVDTAMLLNILFFVKHTDYVSASCTLICCTFSLKLNQSEG